MFWFLSSIFNTLWGLVPPFLCTSVVLALANQLFLHRKRKDCTWDMGKFHIIKSSCSSFRGIRAFVAQH